MSRSQPPGIDTIGDAPDGEQGLALIRRAQPDVALVDVHMPGLSGIELTDRVRKSKLATTALVPDCVKRFRTFASVSGYSASRRHLA